MSQNFTNEHEEQASTEKKSGGFGSLLGKIDSVGESGLRQLLLNMPFVLFLVVLATLHIANNHLADNMARDIAKTEKQVKDLHWKYMTSTSDLMQKSKLSEVAVLVNTQGLRELRIPPYKIEVKD
ncbi:MAG: hypothetical protein JNK66_09725 [Chitinophagales bacterium]|nr:hypothetical protein [Chitinophagales bacterium]